MQTNNKDGFLSLDFGLREFAVKSVKERLRICRRFVHGKGSLNSGEVERFTDFEIGAIEKFKYRSRYVTNSGIIGTKAFVSHHYRAFKHLFSSKHEKRPKTIRG